MKTDWFKGTTPPPPPTGIDLLMLIDDAGVGEYIIGHVEEDEDEGDVIVTRGEVVPIECLVAWTFIPKGVEEAE